MREVTNYEKQSVYRARVERHTKGLFRKRDGWRFVIERRWSQIPRGMSRPEDWRPFRRGSWMPTEAEATRLANAWLDDAEAEAERDGYV